MDPKMVLLDAPRLLLALVLAACVVAVLPSAAADAAKRRAKADCADTHVMPGTGNLGAVRAAVLCLQNRERAARGLRPLKENARLRRAALGHSADMVSGGYFAHESRSGADMADRILRTGYGRGGGWSLGENIAWGTGSLATAAEIHRAWMESPGHKANILRRQFREIGIGIALGAPGGSGGGDGATYTADFGVRR
jgi:uncharacterized protein YkwD